MFRAPRHLKHASCLLLMLAALTASPSAQARRILPGAVLMGEVVDGDTGRGLARAIVTIEQEGRVLNVVTDDRGRYLFSRLPEGRYRVSAVRDRYLPGTYGQEHPGASGLHVTLTSGLWLSDVNIRLWVPAVISGDVRTRLGDPVPAVTVTAYRRTATPGATRLIPAASAETDDLGRYRIHGLVPGPYVVGTSPALVDLDALNGVFAPQYFPGADAAAWTVPVDAQSGFDFGAVNFVISIVDGVPVTGTITALPSSDAGTTTARVTISAPQVPLSQEPLVHRQIAQVETDDDGRFVFPAVPPGTWEIAAHGGTGTWARHIIQVTDTEPEPVTMALQPPVGLEGRLVLQQRTTRPVDLSRPLRIRLDPLFEVPANISTSRTVPVGESFSIGNLLPGAYQIHVEDLPNGVTLDAITANGMSVLDQPLMVGEQATVVDVQITLVDTMTQLLGTIARRDIRESVSASVVVFPADATLTGPHRRRVVRVGPDGVFVVFNLPPGDYVLAAVSGGDEVGWEAPERLDQLRRTGLVVPLRNGEIRVVQVPQEETPSGRQP
ncbi:MAG: carboxypeptidase regulatory-like domain-containing protein [Vicinamibacterales bacterium]